MSSPHALDDDFHRQLATLFLVQIEVVDDSLETRSTQDLLGNQREAICDLPGDGRAHVLLRHTLGDDHDQRLRPEPIRYPACDDDGGRSDQGEWHQHQPLLPPDHATQVVDRIYASRNQATISRLMVATTRHLPEEHDDLRAVETRAARI